MSGNLSLIGVTTSARKGHFMWWCIWLAVLCTGGKAQRITALNGRDYKQCDGYIISGGADIDPQCYGQENIASIDIEPERDTLEKTVITHAIKHGKPLFGICRGLQMINVVQEGTLHQDARDFYETFIPTDSLLGKIFARRRITLLHDGILKGIFQRKSAVSVNSLHHQAINALGKHLKIVAEDDHGIVQAIESDNPGEQFILAVQWHPEFMLYRKAHRRLFKSVVSRAK